MQLVLGVSMTPTTVGMVLVEGAQGDGITVDHDVFDITGSEGSETPSASHPVVAAILGTRQSALAAGHTLAATGVTCSDRDQASALRQALGDGRIDDVLVFSELHAAGALAQAAGRVVGYDTTALLLVKPDSATLALVDTADGSIVKVLNRGLHGVEVMAVLSELVADLQTATSPPAGLFIVGAGADVSSVKEHLHSVVSLPISAPDDAELAMARGAALAAARAPRSEASTIALAYAQDPDDTTDGAAAVVDLGVASELAATPGAAEGDEVEPQPAPSDGDRKPFLLVGSSLTAIFVLGVVTLVISLAVSIRPTADQRPSPGQSAVLPSTAAPASPAPPPVREAQPVLPPAPPPVSAPSAPETIPAPVPVVQQAPAAPQPPRTVIAQPPPARSPEPAARAPAAVPPAAPPAPLTPPAAPVPMLPAPAPVLPPILQLPFLPHPVYRPPVQPPPYDPPTQQQPPYNPPQQQSPYYPPVQPWPQAPLQQSPRYPQYPPAPGYRPGRGPDGPRNGSRLPWWLYPGD